MKSEQYSTISSEVNNLTNQLNFTAKYNPSRIASCTMYSYLLLSPSGTVGETVNVRTLKSKPCLSLCGVFSQRCSSCQHTLAARSARLSIGMSVSIYGPL